MNRPGGAAISLCVLTSPLTCAVHPWSVHYECAEMTAGLTSFTFGIQLKLLNTARGDVLKPLSLNTKRQEEEAFFGCAFATKT